MKNLIAVSVVMFTLGFSTLSFASDHMDLYIKVPAVIEVSGNVKGGEVQTSPMSFYLGDHNVHVTETLRIAENGVSDEKTLLVFGVRI